MWLNDQQDQHSEIRGPSEGGRRLTRAKDTCPYTQESTAPSPNKAADVDGGERVPVAQAPLGGKALLAELGTGEQAATARPSRNQSQ